MNGRATNSKSKAKSQKANAKATLDAAFATTRGPVVEATVKIIPGPAVEATLRACIGTFRRALAGTSAGPGVGTTRGPNLGTFHEAVIAPTRAALSGARTDTTARTMNGEG
jgi:hypothetical protein